MEAARQNCNEIGGAVHHVSGTSGNSKYPSSSRGKGQPWSKKSGASWSKKSSTSFGGSQKCYRCTGSHQPTECPFKSAECHGCHKTGHIRKACRGGSSKANQVQRGHGSATSNKVHEIHNTTDMGGDEVNVYELYKCSSDSNDKGIMISVQVNGADLDMELDTGASVSVMGSDTFNALWSQDRPTIHHTTAQLRTYTNDTIETMGTVEVTVLYNGQVKCYQ